MKQMETMGTLVVRYERGEWDKEFLLKDLRALANASEVHRLREGAGVLFG